jgi:hypothetical protein
MNLREVASGNPSGQPNILVGIAFQGICNYLLFRFAPFELSAFAQFVLVHF